MVESLMTVHTIDKETIYSYLEEINDPEVPVLSIIDLGIVRNVKMNDEELEVIITPTYTGCPAMDMIAATIKIQLGTLGFKKIKITQALSPAWTTEWMSEEGKRKLEGYGIAPPSPRPQVCDQRLFAAAEAVQCADCNSYHAHRAGEFGSTACKGV